MMRHGRNATNRSNAYPGRTSEPRKYVRAETSENRAKMIEREFIDWLHGTDTNILLCWDLGHIWDGSIYDDYQTLAHGAFMLIGTCQRGCGVRRSRYLTSTWSPDAAKNAYTYPTNYSPKNVIRGGFFMDAKHRAMIRQEIGRRAKEKQELESARDKSNVTQIKFKPA